MHSFLIISSHKKNLEGKVKQMCDDWNVDLFDQIILESETSIGIKDIRELQNKLLLKPYKSPVKAVIVYHADSMTSEAQNAFLKTLEEPPDATMILMTANTVESFLPTILSRCKVIVLHEEASALTPQERDDLSEMFEQLFSESTGEKLFLAQKYGDKKENTTIWLEKAILYLRELLLLSLDENDRQELFVIDVIENFQEVYDVVKKTNVSPRLALEQLFLHIS